MSKQKRLSTLALLVKVVLIFTISLILVIVAVEQKSNFSLGIIGDANGPTATFITLSPSLIYIICIPILILLFYYGWKKLKANN